MAQRFFIQTGGSEILYSDIWLKDSLFRRVTQKFFFSYR
jgi:hypothetical protein